jgi:ribosomal protein S17E
MTGSEYNRTINERIPKIDALDMRVMIASYTTRLLVAQPRKIPLESRNSLLGLKMTQVAQAAF